MRIQLAISLALLLTACAATERSVRPVIADATESSSGVQSPADQFAAGQRRELGQGVAADPFYAVGWYRKAAAPGYAPAQSSLARMLSEGRGVPQDKSLAAHWLQQAAAQGLADAQYQLGMAHDIGWGVDEDDALAFQWYLKAAQQGHAQAQSSVGFAYWMGREGFLPVDEVQALYWLGKAAAQGEAMAQINLATLYRTGKNIERDLAQAAFWMSKAALQGDTEAQLALAWMYLTAEGVQRNPVAALHWFEQAATHKLGGTSRNWPYHTEANLVLLRLYAGAAGLPLNEPALIQSLAAIRGEQSEAGDTDAVFTAEMVAIVRRHAEAGDESARLLLAEMYIHGNGVTQDSAAAAQWLEQAVDDGSLDAAILLAQLHGYGSERPADPQKALYWLERAAQLDVEGQLMLASVYLDGELVPTDLHKARSLLLALASGPISTGWVRSTLATLYDRGIDGAPDHEAAAYWWQKAAQADDAYTSCWLGDLYAKGKGVQQDRKQAYRAYVQTTARTGSCTEQLDALLRELTAEELAEIERDPQL